MTCPCEVCKVERAQRRLERALRKTKREAAKAEAARRAALEALSPMQKNHLRIGHHVASVTAEHLDEIWQSADGSLTRLQGMSLSHLYFAAAKMCRDGRRQAQRKLESEILRRLSRAFYPQSYRDPNAAGNYRDARPIELGYPTEGE